MNTTTEQLAQQKSDKQSTQSMLLIASATLFAIICAISTFLFFENMRLTSAIEKAQADSSQYATSIEKIKSDKKIIAAELVTNNKSTILQDIKKNEAQTYISELISIARNYKMIFTGFSYENGKITTSATSIPETILAGDDGIRKISQFIGDYRTGSGSIFQLAPVLTVSGHEQKRNFSIEFNVTNTPQQ
ncbi:hypothetical protein AUK10_00660 [Candidatus Gracilibacteria bacterium CG2_30_37_12]|nr:MAG: hypothetical protein AUK10_00660 [Candidatus Gracilibacteria bacterium CG2_30_37_12]